MVFEHKLGLEYRFRDALFERETMEMMLLSVIWTGGLRLASRVPVLTTSRATKTRSTTTHKFECAHPDLARHHTIPYQLRGISLSPTSTQFRRILGIS